MNSPSTQTNTEPIFIFGSARSGTSLLSRIIDSHPNISVPFESHLYDTFIPWLKYYGDLGLANNREQLVDDILSTECMRDWSPRPSRERILAEIHTFDFGGVVDGLLRSWSLDQGKQRWGEKTPWHAYFWREIINDFPRCKIIHIVRDGRDSSLSWKNARFGPKHYYFLAKKWVQFLQAIDELKAEIGQDSIFEIRYEDLLLNPEEKSREICSFIGEEFSSDMLNFYANSNPYPTDKANLKNLTKPIISSNSNKWKAQMSARDLRVFEAVAGEYLEQYGYERVVDSPTISSAERFLIKYLEHPPRKIVSMIKNRKGHIDGLRRLAILGRLVTKR